MPYLLRTGAYLWFLVVLIIGLGACDSSSSPEGPLAPNFLDDGESWTYETTITQRPVDSTKGHQASTTEIRLEVTKTGAELGGRSGLIQVNAFSPSNPEKINRSWYQQSPDSLVAYASSIEGVAAAFNFSRGVKSLKTANLVRGLTGPPLLVQKHLRDRGTLDAKARADTTVRKDSRVVLRAPLEDGATWTAFDFRARNGDRFRNRRTVLGDTTLTTPAGQYDAVEVQTIGTFGDNTFRWSDFYSEAGLVKHVYTDTLEQTDEFNDTITGEVIVREVHTLTDHEE